MIYEASFRGLLNFIFWLVAISFILRFIARLATPYVVRKAQEQMRNQMFGQDPYQSQHRQRPEGEVTVEKKPKQNPGEYTDYIEIKD
ncbi:MAG: hypothetical protein RLZZ262_1364 [Bacteroidota bacterium]|jgi:hypothetical protein